MLVAGGQKNESCNNVLNFLERPDEETVLANTCHLILF